MSCTDISTLLSTCRWSNDFLWRATVTPALMICFQCGHIYTTRTPVEKHHAKICASKHIPANRVMCTFILKQCRSEVKTVAADADRAVRPINVIVTPQVTWLQLDNCFFYLLLSSALPHHASTEPCRVQTDGAPTKHSVLYQKQRGALHRT